MTAEPQSPLILSLRWILENRKQPNGRKMSMRALSMAAGLSAGHVEQILNKRQSSDIEISTLEKLAQAGDVRLEWLRTHKGDPGKYEGASSSPAGASPAPPPVSETRTIDDKIGDLLNGAWNDNEHEPSDAVLVEKALLSQAALIRAHVEPLDVVRALLDTAADARVKGKKISAEDLPVVALGATKRQLLSAEERIKGFMRKADEEAAMLGVETRESPHPLLKQMRARMHGTGKKKRAK